VLLLTKPNVETFAADVFQDLEIAHKRIENGEAVIDSNTAKLVALEEENEKNKAAIISKDDTILVRKYLEMSIVK